MHEPVKFITVSEIQRIIREAVEATAPSYASRLFDLGLGFFFGILFAAAFKMYGG